VGDEVVGVEEARRFGEARDGGGERRVGESGRGRPGCRRLGRRGALGCESRRGAGREERERAEGNHPIVARRSAGPSPAMSKPFVHAPPPIRGAFRTDDAACAVYSESAGVLRRVPRAVAVPADADDLVVLARWAAAERVPLIPRGSGSSMAGGAVGDGVVVDLSRLAGLSRVDNTRPAVWG